MCTGPSVRTTPFISKEPANEAFIEWTSVRARDASLTDGNYQRLLSAAGTVSERGPVVMSLKDSQYAVLERILSTPVPEFAVTAVKGSACREGAERAVQGMLANPHERTTQGELALAAVDDEDCIVFICGWNSVEVSACIRDAPCSDVLCRTT